MRSTRETARNFGSLMVFAMIAAAEALGQESDSPEPRRRIVVSIPARKLALMEHGRIVKLYDVAVGAPESPTPSGTFTIVERVKNPAWYGPDKVVGPGKDNPVGPRWLGLSRKGYGIHGTNNPRSIGKRASHGCVRMRNRDVEDLFERVSKGDTVELRNERGEELAEIFGGTAIAAGGGQ